MGRLTGYNSFGGVYGIGMGCGDNTDTIHNIIKRLAYYEDLEEQGVLLVLPCKVGDTVYWLDYNRDACNDCDCYSSFYGMDSMCDYHYELYPEIDSVDDDEHCSKHFIEIIEKKTTLTWIVNYWKFFGKTIFLTREEAERALKEYLERE